MKKILLLSAVGLSLLSCRLDDNVSPNNPTLDQVGPRKRITAAQTTAHAVQVGSMNGLGNIWMNSWAGNNYYFGNPATKEMNLNIDANFYGGIWSGIYATVGRLQYIIDMPQAQDLPFHTAMAKILKAHHMQYIVDLYGNAPYTEAFQGAENLTPAYDNDLDIYKALYTELEEAIELIDNTTPLEANKVTDQEDVIFGSSINPDDSTYTAWKSNWKSFANTVKLRYLVRMSKTTDADAIAFRDAKLPLLAGQQFITNDVTINPGYNSSSAASQNPLYRNYGLRNFDHSLNTNGWRLYRGSAHMINTLFGKPGTIAPGVVDYRVAALFDKGYASGQYVGLVQGEPKDQSITNDLYFSGFGGTLGDTSEVTGSAKEGVVMLKAEAELLQAEAAVVYPSYFSNGKSHFDAAIQASYDFDASVIRSAGLASGVAGYAGTYINAIDSVPNVGWTASTDKLAAIQYQRWVALANYNAMETYINYVKTGYPVTPLALTAQKTNKPYRLVYPSSEYTSNGSNVPSMTGDDCFTINNFTPFIYK